MFGEPKTLSHKGTDLIFYDVPHIAMVNNLFTEAFGQAMKPPAIRHMTCRTLFGACQGQSD
jgi:hypothetical protein